MRFYIDKKSIIYDGNPSSEPWQTIEKDVSEDEVKAFFADKELWNHPRFGKVLQTKPDSMGCYDLWRVGVHTYSILPQQSDPTPKGGKE